MLGGIQKRIPWFLVLGSLLLSLATSAFAGPGTMISSLTSVLTNPFKAGPVSIQTRQLEDLEALLKPGDILLSRPDHFVLDFLIPGFWTQSMVYVGSAEKTLPLLNRPEVNQVYAQKCETLRLACSDFSSYLAIRLPQQNLAWRERRVLGSKPVDLVETRARRIQMSSLYWGGKVDYLVALRPRGLEPLQLAATIDALLLEVQASASRGTAHNTSPLGCADDAIIRSYPFLDLLTVEQTYASMSFANALVKDFSSERESDSRKFDFIAFLDRPVKGRGIEANFYTVENAGPGGPAELHASTERSRFGFVSRRWRPQVKGIPLK